MTIDPFLLRAFAAGLMLAIVAAPLGCLVVWQRMSYFGETIANASLIGVALALLLKVDLTLGAVVAALAVAGLLIALSRQREVPMDAVLGLTAHGALAVGFILATRAGGASVDLLGFLFGDIFAIGTSDLAWVALGGAVVLAALAWMWRPLLAIAVHDEIAAAEGLSRERTRAIFIVLLAVAIAAAIKLVGILLAIAFLVMPAIAARRFAGTPEAMVAIAAVIGCVGVCAGLSLSLMADTPGGPSVVVVLAVVALASLLGRTLSGRSSA